MKPIKVVFAFLILLNLSLAWNARDKVLQGNNDFISYYTAAQVLRDHQGASLYDLNLQTSYQQRIPNAFRFKDGVLAYNHPPFEAVWFLPLGALSYLQAYAVWTLISFGLLVLVLFVLVKTHAEQQEKKPDVGLIVMATASFLPVAVCLLQGQDSILTLLFLSVVYREFRRSNDGRAGLWLSLVLNRFQLLPAILLVLAVKRRWRALGTFCMGAVIFGLVSLGVVGFSGIHAYFQLLREMAGWVDTAGIYPSTMHNLRGFWHALFYKRSPVLALSLTILGDLILVGLLLNAWKGKWNVTKVGFDLRFALLVLVSLLVSPHVNLHDLTLLILPGVLLYRFTLRLEAERPIRRWLNSALIVAGYPLILGSLVLFGQGHFQLSVLGLVATAALVFYTLALSKGSEFLKPNLISEPERK